MKFRLPGRPWFRRKRVGFGYSPKTWEGWLFTLCYAGGLVLFSRAAHPSEVPFLSAAIGLTAVFLVFVVLKSEDPRQAEDEPR